MSSEQEQIRSLAERVARRLSSSEQAGGGPGDAKGGGDLAALRHGLDEIQKRLAHIESHIGHDDSCESAPRSAAAEQPRASNRQNAPAQKLGGDAHATDATPSHSLRLSGTYLPATEHPSDERFGIDEAVSEMVDFFEREKTCNLEPGDKPCDHCGMCSSRGF